MSSPQSPICIIPTGLPALTHPTQFLSPTSYLYTLPRTRPYNHITVFLLPGITLPPDTAAAVYISLPTPQWQSQPQTSGNINTGGTGGTERGEFKFLGGIGPGKESAVFKISGLGNGDIDLEQGDINLGISLESAVSVSAQMAALSTSSSTSSIPPSSSQALVKFGPQAGGKPDTLILAQRIIKNAFNFLASFSGNLEGGVEVVPLRAFEEWWKRFEGRVRSDPGFLERDVD